MNISFPNNVSAELCCFTKRPEKFYLVFKTSEDEACTEEILKSKGIIYRVAHLSHTLEIYQPHLLLIKSNAHRFWIQKPDANKKLWVQKLLNTSVFIPENEKGWCVDNYGKLSLIIDGPLDAKTHLKKNYGNLLNESLIKEWIGLLPFSTVTKQKLLSNLSLYKNDHEQEAFRITSDLDQVAQEILQYRKDKILHLKTLGNARKNCFGELPREIWDKVAMNYVSDMMHANFLIRTFYLDIPK